MYQKEIIYMGLHKDGSRVGSAGFLKAEKGDKTSALTMVVKNIPHSIEGRFPVRYCLGTAYSGQTTETGDADGTGQTEREDWKEEDGITLRDGGGVWEKKELEASERIHVQILLPNGYRVEGESKAVGKQAPPKVERLPVTEQRNVPAAEEAVAVSPQRNVPAAAEAVAVSPQRNVPAVEEAVAVSLQRNVPAAEPTVTASSQAVVPERPPLMADALAIEGLKEDKWEQILDTYDRIHPYGDSRVYVKLAPKDFIIFSSNYQHLVNNSFLLHGFYNYRYVILGKNENLPGESSSENEYCLGVPGVFYEREKMVALMFGFEAFECEGGDPKPGDFGYYLRKVEL